MNLTPRIINQSRLAEYLGKSKGWLSMHMGSLREQGFPEKLPLVDGYDVREVDAWLDSIKTKGKHKDTPKTDWSASRGAFK